MQCCLLGVLLLVLKVLSYRILFFITISIATNSSSSAPLFLSSPSSSSICFLFVLLLFLSSSFPRHPGLLNLCAHRMFFLCVITLFFFNIFRKQLITFFSSLGKATVTRCDGVVVFFAECFFLCNFFFLFFFLKILEYTFFLARKG